LLVPDDEIRVLDDDSLLADAVAAIGFDDFPVELGSLRGNHDPVDGEIQIQEAGKARARLILLRVDGLSELDHELRARRDGDRGLGLAVFKHERIGPDDRGYKNGQETDNPVFFS
jgi:hypothetical protein